jgi:hypothetical protein
MGSFFLEMSRVHIGFGERATLASSLQVPVSATSQQLVMPQWNYQGIDCFF